MTSPVKGLRSWTIVSFASVATLALLLIGWAGTARISSAVVASATLSLEDDTPPVQHAYGGQVTEVLVGDGDLVKAGDVLVTFDASEMQQQRDASRIESDMLRIRLVRLVAQIDGAETIDSPTDLHASADSTEIRRALGAAKSQLDGWYSVLNAQEAQLGSQPGMTPAYREAQMTAVRAAALLEAESERSSTLEQINVVDDRLETLAEQLERVEVIAPTEGTVYGTERLVPGRVIMAGETMMYLAADPGAFVARAVVNPPDVGSISPGGEVRLELVGPDPASTPQVSGVITYISPEAQVDPETNASYYAVTVELTDSELEELPAGIQLSTGMPVNALMTTGERTVLHYLLEPALSRLDHAMRES